MFIRTEPTPNPSALKFLPGIVLLDCPLDFPSKQTASISPLVTKLFDVIGVESIFVGSDFITVTRLETADWAPMKPQILSIIAEHVLSKDPILSEESRCSEETLEENDSDVVRDIKDILEAKVRPAVARDGGDIVFDRFEDGVVYLRLKGACSGCPSSTMTLKSGIENMLRYYIPEVVEVRSSNA